MKFITLITCLLLNFASEAQIFTPSFKNYTLCPDSYSQIDRCIGWRQPTAGTSDYFNTCAPSGIVGIPFNIFGYQDSPDSAYAGLFTYYNGYHAYREYIGTSIAPLIIGHTYTMSIVVSLSDSSAYATDGLGVFFSTYVVNNPILDSSLSVTPQVDYSSYGIITDKLNWVTLSKTFVADSAYTNLVVGCFKPDGTINVTNFPDIEGVGPDGKYGYYYIARIGIPDTGHVVIDTTSIDTTSPPPPPPPIAQDTLKIKFPTAFSPNGDGTNEGFHIIANPGYQFSNFSLSVFNRWGQRVFFSENANAAWDGTYNNIPQEVGAYFYMALFTVNGQQRVYKGDVTLVR